MYFCLRTRCRGTGCRSSTEGTEGGSAAVPAPEARIEPGAKARDISSDHQVPKWPGTPQGQGQGCRQRQRPRCRAAQSVVHGDAQRECKPDHLPETPDSESQQSPLPLALRSCQECQPRVGALACAGNHRVIESLRLGKTSKIIESNHHPSTPTPAKPRPEVPHLHVF